MIYGIESCHVSKSTQREKKHRILRTKTSNEITRHTIKKWEEKTLERRALRTSKSSAVHPRARPVDSHDQGWPGWMARRLLDPLAQLR